MMIKCADCCFAAADKNASEYTPKRCGKCELRQDCGLKKTDTVCPEQTLKWSAYECINPGSEYYRALLNVSVGGEMQETVTWTGCEEGERK